MKHAVFTACITAVIGPVVFCLLVIMFRALGEAMAHILNLLIGGPY